MADLKTKPTDINVNSFLETVEPERRREDGKTLCAMMARITGETPKLWGTSMVGFGQYHYKYESGREGDLFVTGFAPRKQNLVVYIMPGYREYGDLLARLGKHKIGKSCLYLTRLDTIDLSVLEAIIASSVEVMKRLYHS